MGQLITLFFLIIINIYPHFSIEWEKEIFILNKIESKKDIDRSITDIKEDNDGFLWLASENGLYRIFGEHIKHFNINNSNLKNLYIKNTLLDNNDIWLINNFDYLYKVKDKKDIELIDIKDKLNLEFIELKDLCKLDNGSILIASNFGLLIYVNNKISFVKNLSIDINYVKAIDNKRVLLSTHEETIIYSFDSEKIIKKLPIKMIKGIYYKDNIKHIYNNKEVYKITDDLKITKVFTLDKGIIQNVIYHPSYGTVLVSNEKIMTIEDNRLLTSKDLDLEIREIYYTRQSNMIWFLTNNGLYYLSQNLPIIKTFNTYEHQSIQLVYDLDLVHDTIFVSTGLTGFFKKEKDKRWEKISDCYSQRAFSVGNKIYLVTLGDGVKVFDKIGNYLGEVDEFNNINLENLRSEKVTDNHVFILINNNLYLFNEDLKEISSYKFEEHGSFIESIHPNPNNKMQLWLELKNKGIYLYDFEKKYTEKLISGNVENLIYKNKKLYYYIKDTIYEFNLDNKISKDIATFNEDKIISFLVDYNNNLWIGGERGLWHIKPEEKYINYFSFLDNVQNTPFIKNQIKEVNDILYFGGKNGVIYFNPALMNNKEKEVNLKILDLTTMSPEKNINVSNLNIYKLKKNNNNFYLDFDIDNHLVTGGRYYTRLMPLEKEWQEVKEKKVYYSRLPKGSYEFQVKYEYYSHTLKSTSDSIIIEILPAFWESDRALQFYFFTALLVGITIWQFNKKVILAKFDKNVDKAIIDLNTYKNLDELSSEFLTKIVNLINHKEILLTYTIYPDCKSYAYTYKNQKIKSGKRIETIQIDENIPKNAFNINWLKETFYYSIYNNNNLEIYFRTNPIHSKIVLFDVDKDKKREYSKLTLAIVKRSSKLWDSVFAYERLLREVNIDSLTAIYNRRYMEKVYDFEVKALLKYKRNFTIALLDIDYFKNVNDSYGHDCGDFILKEFSKLILNNIESKDTFGRYGGEEFLLLIGDDTFQNAKEKLDRLRKIIENYVFEDNEHKLQLTVSIGAFYITPNENELNLESVLKKADINLYSAKEDGRNKLVIN